MKLAVFGASGRMGRAVVRLAVEAGDLEVTCAVGATEVGIDVGELAGVRRLGVAVTSDAGALAASGAQVVVDFSSPVATAALTEAAERGKIAIVSGTTGLDDAGRASLDRAAANVAVLWEPNMSLGVHVLADIVKKAVLALGPAYDVEIVEAHHRKKVDAPSGTALRLAEAVRSARDVSKLVHGREGKPGARTRDEVGMHAVRGGDVIGDHTVHLLGDGERLEITHRATTRDVFAHGALRAARWIADKPPGTYALSQILG